MNWNNLHPQMCTLPIIIYGHLLMKKLQSCSIYGSLPKMNMAQKLLDQPLR